MNWWQKFLSEAKRLLKSVVDRDLMDVLRTLTLIVLLAHEYKGWYIRGPLLSLVILGLISRTIRSHPSTWFLVSTLLTLWTWRNWYTINNHDYLYVYWAWSLALTSLLPSPQQTKALATSSCLLLGAVMALATIQKVISPSFTSGAFMEFVLLCDVRFQPIAWLGGGVDLLHLQSNAQNVKDWVQSLPGMEGEVVIARHGWRVETIVWILTWGAIVLEGAVAAAFLIPSSQEMWVRMRTSLLIVFIVVTYPVAPVFGFGWILALLGMAQLPPKHRRLHGALLLMFVLLPLVDFSPARFYTFLKSLG